MNIYVISCEFNEAYFLFIGGKKKAVWSEGENFKSGDIVGCGLDLTIPQITFSVNGKQVLGFFKDCNLTGLFFPVISMSAKVG